MEPFLGQLMLVSFNFPPKGWAICAGQLLPINSNQALFSLLGTVFGGDGRTTFALPDLRGRAAMSSGAGAGLQNYSLGQAGGEESHTLNMSEMTQHTHVMNATNDAADKNSPAPPGSSAFASTTGPLTYSQSAPNAPMVASMVTTIGGSQPHENRQPFLAAMWIIALQGIFPSRN